MTDYVLGQKDKAIFNMQRALNEKMKINLTTDGHFGKITQSYLADFQKQNNFTEVNVTGNYYGPKTQLILGKFISEKYIKELDIINAANKLKVEVACVKAVMDVEAKQSGFFNNGQPVILFERHVFYNQLRDKLGTATANNISKSNSDVCNQTPGGYIGGMKELDRLTKAANISVPNNFISEAYCSASWGLFQIMGYHYKTLGYDNVTSFINDMKKSEALQLDAFIKFIITNPKLHEALKDKSWSEFARRYNGPNYKLNQYDDKLAKAYQNNS